MKKVENQKAAVQRRQFFKAFGILGIGAPLALEADAQSKSKVSVPILKDASVILGEKFSDSRTKVIEIALQRNLDQFQILRAFQVDDLVEPAPMFLSKRYAGESVADRRKG